MPSFLCICFSSQSAAVVKTPESDTVILQRVPFGDVKTIPLVASVISIPSA